MKLFITGGSGYVGAMLAEQFASRMGVEAILLLDKEPLAEALKTHPFSAKISFIHANLGDNGWQDTVKAFAPDVIIHTAWQIREMYMKKPLQWKWNVVGSDNVFDLAFSLPSVKRLLHFSTVASYGAFPENTTDHFFKEEEGFRKSNYLYAEEKRIVEEHLAQKFTAAKSRGGHVPKVAVVRPVAITGPRGRYLKIRFGLQSALSGQISGSFAYSIVKAMVSFVPITKKWLRQFIHEDDVTNIVELLALNDLKSNFEIFNICPAGEVVLGPDMARAVGKKSVCLPPWLIRIAFFCVWHITLGKITTSRGGWKSYSYPIAVDGTKLSKMYGYHYLFSSKDAFTKLEGRYAKYVKNGSK